jgi:hypothetical protein
MNTFGSHIKLLLNTLSMKLLVILSVINISSNPLSYTNTRSIFSPEERFQQTLNSIESIRRELPDYNIMLVECSDITSEQTEQLKSRVDIFVNMMDDTENRDMYLKNTTSLSKALGECEITLFAFRYCIANNIQIDSFMKLSGRYWLNDSFPQLGFEQHPNCIHYNTANCITTVIYKFDYETMKLWYEYLLAWYESIETSPQNLYMGFETIFADFINSISNKIPVHILKHIGVSGLVSVDGNNISW